MKQQRRKLMSGASRAASRVLPSAAGALVPAAFFSGPFSLLSGYLPNVFGPQGQIDSALRAAFGVEGLGSMLLIGLTGLTSYNLYHALPGARRTAPSVTITTSDGARSVRSLGPDSRTGARRVGGHLRAEGIKKPLFSLMKKLRKSRRSKALKDALRKAAGLRKARRQRKARRSSGDSSKVEPVEASRS